MHTDLKQEKLNVTLKFYFKIYYILRTLFKKLGWKSMPIGGTFVDQRLFINKVAVTKTTVFGFNTQLKFNV